MTEQIKNSESPTFADVAEILDRKADREWEAATRGIPGWPAR